jgi:hypothetical protein
MVCGVVSRLRKIWLAQDRFPAGEKRGPLWQLVPVLALEGGLEAARRCAAGIALLAGQTKGWAVGVGDGDDEGLATEPLVGAC